MKINDLDKRISFTNVIPLFPHKKAVIKKDCYLGINYPCKIVGLNTDIENSYCVELDLRNKWLDYWSVSFDNLDFIEE